jgi:hypothetical protein
MWYLILSILILGILAALLGRIPRSRETLTPPCTPPGDTPDVCCQQHEICRQNNRHDAANQPIDYYNDEELDRFRGTGADAYADEDADEFRDILYSLQTSDVPGWLNSLQQRSINLPDALRDEALLIVREQHLQYHTK